jgi:hypothetical protein
VLSLSKYAKEIQTFIFSSLRLRVFAVKMHEFPGVNYLHFALCTLNFELPALPV